MLSLSCSICKYIFFFIIDFEDTCLMEVCFYLVALHFMRVKMKKKNEEWRQRVRWRVKGGPEKLTNKDPPA